MFLHLYQAIHNKAKSRRKSLILRTPWDFFLTTKDKSQTQKKPPQKRQLYKSEISNNIIF